MKPVFPTNLLSMPFCQSGTKTLIPDDDATLGRATLAQGFPVETQLPEDLGGVAPNRLDFNGALYMATALAFWNQSGGQAIYQASLNYPVPSIVYENGILYWCLAENGPETAAGVVAPGTDDAIWMNMFTWLLQSSGASTTIGVPVGTIIMFSSAAPPDGFFVCDGAAFSATTYPKLFQLLGKAQLPDFRGQFVRGYDPVGVRDPDGKQRALFSSQTDAGRALNGGFGIGLSNGSFGCCYQIWDGRVGETARGGGGWTNSGVAVDATRSWGADHVASEFRPANVSVQYCIKHD